ncbi:hypothetical protein ES288_A09G014000v1 [Gossypium darwinii]|uniref:Uncharacterized protein n=1 Tax=Gossypium darwinii TaxID=34276 RepID=A0A5D2F492_GOSDA|nr:hypothetical protein ES288_A09G014000v1 [Gossypium darwinii]
MQTPNRPLTADFSLQPSQFLKNHFSLDLPSNFDSNEAKRRSLAYSNGRTEERGKVCVKEAVRGNRSWEPDPLALFWHVPEDSSALKLLR